MSPDFGPATVDEYWDALLTPARFPRGVHSVTERARKLLRRALREPTTRQHRVVGAVYSAGRLVAASQRDPFPDVAPVDPDVLTEQSEEYDSLDGTWLYGGHWMGLFGHFLLETLSTLWLDPSRTQVAGLVFHLWPSDGYAMPPLVWQRRLVDRAGWEVPVHLVSQRAVRVEHLLLPTRAYRLHRGGLPEVRSVWDRIAPAQVPDTAVFLSRSRLTKDPRRTPYDARLDSALASAGCLVVHPQELPIDEQIAVVSRAHTLIGASGSQLHLSMFAGSCQRVIELGDLRLPTTPVFDQLGIAQTRGQEHHFVPLITTDNGRDVGATIERILAIGLEG